ncbi:MAG: hypothetical protein EOP84_02305 [Verrucomicrobiaceae bacterium]|nr:MAG: hypothetical protein EOP84_02305 [Verrucomicrobiaceae bacterium]
MNDPTRNQGLPPGLDPNDPRLETHVFLAEDPSSLEYFTGPFDSYEFKDGRKLSEDEMLIRLLAYRRKFGSEGKLVASIWNTKPGAKMEPGNFPDDP